MDKVLTLIGQKSQLDETQISEVIATLAGMGAKIDAPYWLAYRTAVDLRFSGIECEDSRELAFEALGVDMVNGKGGCDCVQFGLVLI